MRKGGRLNENIFIFSQASFSEKFELAGVKMYNLGGAPGCMWTENKEDKIVAEVWEFEFANPNVEENVIAMLDQIEGVHTGLYSRCVVDTPRGTAYMYFHNFQSEPDEEDRIYDWMEEVVKGNHRSKNAYIHVG
jgi:gamma-glutamylcyclotransferase (GGCT)/AIG2-like uncharacterized protein YtfP